MNDVFADIFNVLVFGGRQVVTPASLEDVAGFSQYKADDTHLHEQERDIYKLWKGQGVNLVIVGMENQTKPERDMPFRCFGYDGASYRSQLLKKTEKQCFHPKLPDNEITEILLPYVEDYKVNLFDIPRLSPEVVKQFRSDFRIVADYFVNAYNNPEYEPDEAVITHVDEFLKLMKVLTGDNRYEAISFTEQEQKEGVRMCKVLDAREKLYKEYGIV